jgi:3-methyladenine DNA glycosylase AlkD
MKQQKKKEDSKKDAVFALTAKQIIDQLKALAPGNKTDNLRYYQGGNKATKSFGNAMAVTFKLAKESMQLSLTEIEKLLDSDYYEARILAVSIMDFQARDKKMTKEQKKKLFELYIRRHDRIDNWDLVDRAAPYVVGGYLFDQPRGILTTLAKSKNPWERRSAIVSTYFFIRQNQVDDTFKIAALLVNDPHELVNKAVGSWVREAGKKDLKQLLHFLDKHAATMPRVTLRYAIEKLDKKQKAFYTNN